ncbi:MAG: acyl-CoA dehydrogenase C-terminal domain-containing protein [Aestuariivita sp.]|nr:acyl-CoA dehydrogenase C-terminal domain-containing protein [Aestuariivita sp.]MCY4346974.1 acyl-CoA dehydrogenase C-terminal domain-containing protein [Aestuariivita sp.]
MPNYQAPTRDLLFVLNDVLALPKQPIAGYEELGRDFLEAILSEAGKICANVLHPLNAIGDREGCQLTAGCVTTPAGFRTAFQQMKDDGWPSLNMPTEFGGQGLPHIVHTAVSEMFMAANQSFAIYQFLTHGAALTIFTHGTEEQKALYLPKLTSCEWTGTMNLTEPQCGTDLALIKTKAEKQVDGSYKLTGEKIFISAGEHDLAENIVHLVLARVVDAPKGIKGISLFIVPKFLTDRNGSHQDRNGVFCTRLEEKMGIHGNATCAMTYADATGYLLGSENKGLRGMFTMMNGARLGVGLQGLAQADVAYQNALAYAKERRQGRSDLNGLQPNPDAPADPIISHPDIRRSLLDQKSFTEGARALVLWVAMLIDRAQRCDDPEANLLVSLLTPVIKGFLTDEGYDATVQAQQIYGGHGYIEEWGMSQYTRDARVAMIYEGANGIQARDLIGRQLPHENFQPVQLFIAEIDAQCDLCAELSSNFAVDFVKPLQCASKDLKEAVQSLQQMHGQNQSSALAGSYDFMHLLGHVCLGLMWVRMARTAASHLETGSSDQEFHEAKLATGKYYMLRRLPATALHLTRFQSGADLVNGIPVDRF